MIDLHPSHASLEANRFSAKECTEIILRFNFKIAFCCSSKKFLTLSYCEAGAEYKGRVTTTAEQTMLRANQDVLVSNNGKKEGTFIFCSFAISVVSFCFCFIFDYRPREIRI